MDGLLLSLLMLSGTQQVRAPCRGVKPNPVSYVALVSVLKTTTPAFLGTVFDVSIATCTDLPGGHRN